jgi:transmembrane sensor
VEEVIARVLSGEASEIEQRKLERWRAASPENERTFQEMAHAWNLTGPRGLALEVPPAPSPQEIIDIAASRGGGVGRRVRAVPLRPAWAWAAAAVALLAVGAGLWGIRTPAVDFATGPAQTVTIPLADGSVVRLAPSSELRVVGANQRQVELNGRAFFAVAADSTRPFVVRTRPGEARVLGTRFEVEARGDSLRLVVVEGRVRLGAEGERVDVAKGFVSRVAAGSGPTTPEMVDVWALLDWPQGLLMFQDTPFAQVAAEISRHFGIPFAIPDTIATGRSVTAWFGDEPLEEVVSTVCQVVGARCVVGDSVEVVQ